MESNNAIQLKPVISKDHPMPLAQAAQEWQVMQEQARALIKSGFLPPTIKTTEQCIAIFLTGRELGIGFMESIRGINVIQGKPTVSPQLMLALARRTGEVEKFSLHAPGRTGNPPDETGAECHIKRNGEPEHVTIFGPKEAKDLNLSGKDNYKKQPGTMYQWRALAANLRVTFPDAICGLYTPEELGADVTVTETEEIQVNPASGTIQISLPEKTEIGQKYLPGATVADPKVAEKIKNTPAPAEFNKEPAPVEEIIIGVKDVMGKEYEKGKWRYGIQVLTSDWYTTFDEKVHMKAEEVRARGTKALIKFRVVEKNQKLFRNIVSFDEQKEPSHELGLDDDIRY